MKKIKKLLIKESHLPNKKYIAIFYNDNGDIIKKTHFGAKGYEDYTIHKDDKRKERYINRHKKEDWTNPYKAGTLSRYILWEYKNINKAIKEYKKKFNLI